MDTDNPLSKLTTSIFGKKAEENAESPTTPQEESREDILKQLHDQDDDDDSDEDQSPADFAAQLTKAKTTKAVATTAAADDTAEKEESDASSEEDLDIARIKSQAKDMKQKLQQTAAQGTAEPDQAKKDQSAA